MKVAHSKEKEHYKFRKKIWKNYRVAQKKDKRKVKVVKECKEDKRNSSYWTWADNECQRKACFIST